MAALDPTFPTMVNFVPSNPPTMSILYNYQERLNSWPKKRNLASTKRITNKYKTPGTQATQKRLLERVGYLLFSDLARCTHREQKKLFRARRDKDENEQSESRHSQGPR